MISTNEMKFTRSEIELFVDRHAKAEFAIDIDATMETVAENPFYEMHPLGLRIEGSAAVREFYTRVLPVYMADVRRPTLRSQSFGENFYTAEYEFAIRQPSGGWRQGYRFGIVEFTDGGLIISERDYNSPAQADMFARALGEDFVNVPGVSRI